MSFIDHGESEESESESESEQESESESHKPNVKRIVSRKEWGAKKPKKDLARNTAVTFVHCFNTFSRECKCEESCSSLLRDIQASNMTEPHFLPDIRFNFVIHESGTIYEGRGWGYEPNLPSNYSHYNHKTLLIGYIGYYTEQNIRSAIEKSRDYLIEYGLEHKYINPQYELRNHLMIPR